MEKEEVEICGEKIYLKKDFLGWRVVETPTVWWRWITGSNRNIFTLLIYLIIALLIYIGVNDILQSCYSIVEEVNSWQPQQYTNTSKLNFSNIILPGD